MTPTTPTGTRCARLSRGGTEIFLCPSPGDGVEPEWTAEFEHGVTPPGTSGAGPPARIDHVNLVQRWQEFDEAVLFYTSAWGTIWTRPGLDRRSRSMITLTALVAGGHHQELAMHVWAARRNGLSVDEIKEVLLQTAIYCGVPDANTAFRIAQAALAEVETTAEEDDQ